MASGIKMAGDDGGTDSSDRTATSQIIGDSASVTFPMHHKIQNDGEQLKEWVSPCGCLPHGCPHMPAQNRRWGNPARTQYNALLGQSIVLIMITAQECGLTDK